MALKYFRDNLKSYAWVLWLVVAVFVVGFVFFDVGGFRQAQFGARGDVAAVVGEDEITYDQYRRQFQNLEATYRQALGEQFNRDLLEQFNLQRQALDQLIDKTILLEEARRIGLQATAKEVSKVIVSYPVFQSESGRFVGTEEYRRILRDNRLSVEGFESMVSDDVLLAKLQSVLAQTLYVPEEEVERSYRETAERAKIRYLHLPASEVGEVAVEPAELEAYFAERRADYELPERRVVDYLLADTVKLRREIEIPDEELRAYYDEHQGDFDREEQVRASHILFKVTPDRPDQQAREELQAVRRRVEAGENFSQLARELSEDEGSASRGGSLGYFGRGQMIPAFEEAAFGAEVGELVGPIKTDFGYHLIQVQDRRAGGLQPFEEVKEVVRARLLSERVREIAESKAQAAADRLQAAEEVTAETMAQLGEEQGLTFDTSEPIGRTDTITGLGRSPDLGETAFNLEVGAVSEPVKVPRGWAVLRLAEVVPPRLPELAEVEDQVREAVSREKRNEVAVARLEEARQNRTEEGGLDAIAGELGLEVQETAELGRFGTLPGIGSSREVIDRALTLQAGEWGGPVKTDRGAVLFEVVERKTFDPAEFEEQKEATRDQQRAQRLNQLLASLIESRKRELLLDGDLRIFVEEYNPSSSAPATGAAG
jgi:peptidyl-prolyl cis-trans isomerase D